MNRIFSISLLIFLSLHAWGQKYTVDKGLITFFSTAPLEDIKATNEKVTSLFNATGEIAFVVPIAQFEFDKPLMRDHFNEKYMETERYPQAKFVGKINNYDAEKKGEQNVTATGKLTLHGVTHDIDIPGVILKDMDRLHVKSKFIVKLADYNIEIPTLLWKNIAEQVDVTVDITYKPQ